jgi:hypothetical protein
MPPSPNTHTHTHTHTHTRARTQIDELRAHLRQLGLSDEGSRYVLRDRLLMLSVVRRAATGGDMDYLMRQLGQVRAAGHHVCVCVCVCLCVCVFAEAWP